MNDQTCTFRGNLEAQVASGIKQSLQGATVHLYRVPEEKVDEEDLRLAATASPKETIRVLSEEEVADKQSQHFAEGEVGEDGEFSVHIPKDANYQEDKQGRPAVFQIDIRVENIPGSGLAAELPIQFTLTTHRPAWRPADEGEGATADKDYTIPKRNWCEILTEAGIWVVCGRVTICGTDDPVGQLSVTAHDADITQHDSLGSAVTNASGQFCIYYTKAQFEETPSPWPSIELIPGPDLYFTIERGGQTLLEEDPSDGRRGNRENAGHCEYYELCVEEPQPDGGEERPTPVPTYWRRIGSAFDAPFLFPGTSDFDSEGYAGSDKYALFGTITMEGSAPLFHSQNPDQFVQYRFRVSENTTSNGFGAPTPSGFKAIGVGSSKYIDAFEEGVTVGEVLAYDPSVPTIRPVPVTINRSHLDGSGWLSVRDAVDDALSSALGTDLQGLRRNNHYFGWNDSDPMMAIDTRQFTSEPDVEDATAPGDPVPDAGDPVPSSRRIGIEKIAIQFEARVVTAGGGVVSSPSSGGSILSGTTLNAVVINNNTEFAQFANVNHQSLGDKCEPLSGDVNLAYTVHHPHLAGVEIVVQRNDGASETLDDPNNEVSFDPGSFSFTSSSIAGIKHFNNSSLAILRSSDPSRSDGPILTKKCGYLARLRVRRRLHNGYSSDGWTPQGTSIFYWEGGGSSP